MGIRGEFVTKKVLVIVLCVVSVLVLSIVPCLASEPTSSPFVLVPAPIFRPIDNPPSDVSISFTLSTYSGSGAWALGVYDSSGNISMTAAFISRVSLSNGLFTAYGDGPEIYILGDGANDVLFYVPSVESQPYVPVDPLMLEYFVNVRVFPASNLFQIVPGFFSVGLSFASGIVDFILSSWITAVVLVLYVGIALFGLFRRLFKGT